MLLVDLSETLNKFFNMCTKMLRFVFIWTFTDDGKVLTVLNVGRENIKTVVIQEIQVFDEPIREMLFLGGSPPKLLIGSDGNLKLMNVRQCFTSRIKSCR